MSMVFSFSRRVLILFKLYFFSCYILLHHIYLIVLFFPSDVDECKDGTDNCPVNTDCVNTKGSYSCRCNEGYRRNEAGDCTGLLQTTYHFVTKPRQVLRNVSETQVMFNNKRQEFSSVCATMRLYMYSLLMVILFLSLCDHYNDD